MGYKHKNGCQGPLQHRPPLAALGMATGEQQGQVQVHLLWDNAKSTQERIVAEGRARAQAGGQTIIAIPAGSIDSLEASNKGTIVRQLVRRLGTFEGWKSTKKAAEGAVQVGAGAGEHPTQGKCKKERVLGELWYIGSEWEWAQLDWTEWSRRLGRVPGGIQWEADLNGGARQPMTDIATQIAHVLTGQQPPMLSKEGLLREEHEAWCEAGGICGLSVS